MFGGVKDFSLVGFDLSVEIVFETVQRSDKLVARRSRGVFANQTERVDGFHF